MQYTTDSTQTQYADAYPFSSADNNTPDSTSECSEEDEEEDFQTVPLDDEHWTSEEMTLQTMRIIWSHANNDDIPAFKNTPY